MKYHGLRNSLLVKELGGCDAEILLELARKVLGIFEAEAFSGFGDGGTTEEERLRALHDEAANVGGSRLARQFADEVTEIVGEKKKFLGAPVFRAYLL